MSSKTLNADLIRSCLLNTKETAIYLSFSESALKQSRNTGKLLGVDAPAFIKIGFTVRYRVETLSTWLEQFSEQNNTSHSA